MACRLNGKARTSPMDARKKTVGNQTVIVWKKTVGNQTMTVWKKAKVEIQPGHCDSARALYATHTQ
jgi:hypothetical protein